MVPADQSGQKKIIFTRNKKWKKVIKNKVQKIACVLFKIVINLAEFVCVNSIF